MRNQSVESDSSSSNYNQNLHQQFQKKPNAVVEELINNLKMIEQKFKSGDSQSYEH